MASRDMAGVVHAAPTEYRTISYLLELDGNALVLMLDVDVLTEMVDAGLRSNGVNTRVLVRFEPVTASYFLFIQSFPK